MVCKNRFGKPWLSMVVKLGDKDVQAIVNHKMDVPKSMAVLARLLLARHKLAASPL